MKKLISVSVIIDEVQNFFPAYFDSGKVDDSILIPVAEKINSIIGLRMLDTTNAIVQIENCKGKLPEDFYKLNHAVLCTSYKVRMGNPAPFIREEKVSCEDDMSYCEKKHPCSLYFDECGNATRIIQRFRFDEYEYTDIRPIQVKVSNNGKCDSGCPNLKIQCGNIIEIIDNELVCNFQMGSVYIDYFKLNSKDDLMVLDHPRIRDWMVNDMIYTTLKYLYLSGEDVQQKLQFFKEESHKAEINGRNILKAEIEDYYQLGKDLRSDYRVFNYLTTTNANRR